MVFAAGPGGRGEGSQVLCLVKWAVVTPWKAKDLGFRPRSRGKAYSSEPC